MAFTHETFPELKLVLVRGQGRIAVREVIAVFDALLADPRREPGFDTIIDLTQVETVEGGSAETRQVVEYQRRFSEEMGPGRDAIVASESSVYGMSRLWMAHAQVLYPRAANVFASLEEARAWLGLPEGKP